MSPQKVHALSSLFGKKNITSCKTKYQNQTFLQHIFKRFFVSKDLSLRIG